MGPLHCIGAIILLLMVQGPCLASAYQPRKNIERSVPGADRVKNRTVGSSDLSVGKYRRCVTLLSALRF